MSKNEVAKNQTAAGAPAKPGLESRIRPTGLNHIAYFDIQDDGRLREVALVKLDKDPSGVVRSAYYIDVGLLDNVDKGRLKAIVTSQHANKYELWELLDQNRLSNGVNALDYFHQLTRVVHGPGAVATSFGNSLLSAIPERGGVVGAEFSDPSSATLDA